MCNTFTSIPTRARGLIRSSNSRGRLCFFSTTPRASTGSFFNLGGLGASREAQYLSKERGIPRTEYNSNIHLIRSSEVDPFAPAPGATRAAAARAARASAVAATQAETYPRTVPYSTRQHAFRPEELEGGAASLEAQLQAVRYELAETKEALRRALQTKFGHKGDSTSMTPQLLSTAIILTAVYFIFKDVSERFTGAPTPRPAEEGLVQQTSTLTQGQVDEATAQRQRDAPLEEQILAESGLTSFEKQQPEVLEPPRRSVLSGLFWART